MSWLFDRLCELAVADRVDVVVHAEVPATTADESVRLADLLVRSARARQFSLSIIRPGIAQASSEADIVVDLELLAREDAEDAVGALVPPSTTSGWFARVEQGVVVVREGHVPPNTLLDDRHHRDQGLRRCVASTCTDTDELLSGLGALDLGIVIGGDPHPGLHVVDDAADLLIVLDALVVLRHVAFGTDAQPEPDGTEWLRRPRLRALLAT